MKRGSPDRYPKPKQEGGTLIREMIATCRAAGLDLPVGSTKASQILCAVSGGSDSVALARLLTRYGRRLASASKIEFLHVNHGWRGKESDADERAVVGLAKKWGVPIHVARLSPGDRDLGDSWEDAARRARKKIYAEWLERHPEGWVFTAHHGDDVAETLLWRLFTGAASTHGAGILVRDNREVRPLVRVRKAQLLKFLKEEKLNWREDRTNQEGRFLRARMRRDLLPEVEKLFPQAVPHLIKMAWKAQTAPQTNESGGYELSSLFFRLGGGRIRRAHWGAIEALQAKGKGELHLPDGWRLRFENPKENLRHERWVLERSKREK